MIAWILVAVLLGILAGIPSVANAGTHVSTIAGSGQTGFNDGTASTASFMLPTGLAYDRDGNLIIVDAAAQRIRELSTSGRIRTLAGGGVSGESGVWVAGAYADGTAAATRFSRPIATAVGPDGLIYVADSYNHCIRVIAKDGSVSTFAGSPQHSGYGLGPRADAQFVFPTGLAFDEAGNLYVIDGAMRGAVKKIDTHGMVTRQKLGDETVQPLGPIAIYDRGAGITFFVAGLDGLTVVRPDGTSVTYRNTFYALQCEAKMAPGWLACDEPITALRGQADIGTPGAIVALNDHVAAYTDYRTNSVNLVDVRASTLRLLAGSSLNDGSGHESGSRDGDGTIARFNAPLGIALAANGTLTVADSGTRRIRSITNVDLREAIASDALHDIPRQLAHPRIAYVGDASSWQGGEWFDSVQGRIERALASSACASCKHAIVTPIVLNRSGANLALQLQNVSHSYDAVVVQISLTNAAAIAGVDNVTAAATPGRWQTALLAVLRSANAHAKGAHVLLYVVAVPQPFDISPAQMLWARERPTERTAYPALMQTLRASGVRTIDAGAAFLTAANTASPPPLFSPAEREFASGGRDIIAQTTALAIERTLTR